MKLFAVIYLHGHLAAAMSLWNGATLNDCRKINSEFSHEQAMKWQAAHLDVRLACEWHTSDPVKP